MMTSKVGRKTVFTEEIKQKIIKLSKEGLGVRRIANQVGISKSSVNRFLREGRDVNRIKSDENSITGGVNLVETKASGVANPNTSTILSIPHSTLITNDLLNNIKHKLGNPDIPFIKLLNNHHNKCSCYLCINIRKKNFLKLKQWADRNNAKEKK